MCVCVCLWLVFFTSKRQRRSCGWSPYVCDAECVAQRNADNLAASRFDLSALCVGGMWGVTRGCYRMRSILSCVAYPCLLGVHHVRHRCRMSGVCLGCVRMCVCARARASEQATSEEEGERTERSFPGLFQGYTDFRLCFVLFLLLLPQLENRWRKKEKERRETRGNDQRGNLSQDWRSLLRS